MDHQPRADAQAESPFFADGAVMRTPVEGTVAVGGLREDTALWTGKAADGSWVSAIPMAVDARVLARGEQRYGVFCTPCHGAQADGKGMLFQRAQVQSANLLEERFRAMPVGQLYDEVTHGFGLMPAYGPYVSAHDRWAILAYLRSVQAQAPSPAAAETAEQTTGEPAAPGEVAPAATAAPGAPAPPAGGGR